MTVISRFTIAAYSMMLLHYFQFCKKYTETDEKDLSIFFVIHCFLLNSERNLLFLNSLPGTRWIWMNSKFMKSYYTVCHVSKLDASYFLVLISDQLFSIPLYVLPGDDAKLSLYWYFVTIISNKKKGLS